MTDLSAAICSLEQAEQCLYSSASSLELAGDAAGNLTIAQLRLAAAVAGMLADSLREVLEELSCTTGTVSAPTAPVSSSS